MDSKRTDWARKVIERINSTLEGAQNLLLATQSVADDTSTGDDRIPDPSTDPFGLLSWLRGDEAEEEFDSGGSPEDYADFLTTEWRLYGPQGE